MARYTVEIDIKVNERDGYNTERVIHASTERMIPDLDFATEVAEAMEVACNEAQVQAAHFIRARQEAAKVTELQP